MPKRASWENHLAELPVNIEYGNGGETTPQYWLCNFTVPGNLTELLRHTRPIHELLAITYHASIVNVDPTITYIGFVGSWFGYTNIPGAPAIDMGAGQIPSAPVLDPMVDSAEYDPTSLPVGGVDFPIWQRKSIDPLTADHYLSASDNPRNLVGFALVQVQGSTFVNPAALVKQWFRHNLET